MGFAFISHRGTDKARLRDFAVGAIERGIPLWVDRPDDFNVGGAGPPITPDQLHGHIKRGTEYPSAIDEALYAAAVTVVFWSSSWVDRIGVLLREYSVAHSLARTGQALYFPAFLDRIADLPPEVAAFRSENNDTTQGYDVSSPVAIGWDRLLDDLFDATRSPQTSSLATRRRASQPGAVEWLAVISERERSPEQTIALVETMPPGPAVDAMIMPARLRRFVAAALPGSTAAGVVADAAATTLATFPKSLRANRFSLIVMPAMVPDPLQVSAFAYWESVFDNACLLGPRMLASLLLVLPGSATHGREPEFANVLQQLEQWEG